MEEDNRIEALQERVDVLERRIQSTELLLRAALAKLYSAHEDFAAELEEIISGSGFPTGWSDGMSRETEARVLQTHELVWKCVRKVRDEAQPYASDWRTTEAHLPRAHLSPTARQNSGT